MRAQTARCVCVYIYQYICVCARARVYVRAVNKRFGRREVLDIILRQLLKEKKKRKSVWRLGTVNKTFFFPPGSLFFYIVFIACFNFSGLFVNIYGTHEMFGHCAL